MSGFIGATTLGNYSNVSTLTNFGIPLGGGQGRGGILQPKTKQKFNVVLFGFGGNPSPVAFTQQVTKVGRPGFNFNPVTVHSYNSVAYYAGKQEFSELSVTVRDDVTNSVAVLVGTQLQLQMDFFQQTTPMSAGDYKFQCWIQALDGGNQTALEQWFLEGCLVSTVNYDEYDYGSADPMTITLGMRFDNATLQGGLMPPATFSAPDHGMLT